MIHHRMLSAVDHFYFAKKVAALPNFKASKIYKGIIENIYAPVITLAIFVSSATLEQYQ